LYVVVGQKSGKAFGNGASVMSLAKPASATFVARTSLFYGLDRSGLRGAPKTIRGKRKKSRVHE